HLHAAAGGIRSGCAEGAVLPQQRRLRRSAVLPPRQLLQPRQHRTGHGDLPPLRLPSRAASEGAEEGAGRPGDLRRRGGGDDRHPSRTGSRRGRRCCRCPRIRQLLARAGQGILMKLASLNQGRDGVLVVVSRDLTEAVTVPKIAATLQAALDDWNYCKPKLEAVYQRLNDGLEQGAFAFEQADCHSPLPRAYHWADGSAYVNHVELVRKARGAEMPESFWHEPLVYQGGADVFIPPHSPIRLADEAWGIDLEGELAVITDDVPMGATPAQAASHIQLLMLVNDVS